MGRTRHKTPRRLKPPPHKTLNNSLERFDAAYREKRGGVALIGVDEVGRGPLAGPVVAAAVLLPPAPLPDLTGVRDSKVLSPKKRAFLFDAIRRQALSIGVGWSSPKEIDEINILQASLRAMGRALARLTPPENALALIDGNKTISNIAIKQEAVVSGDTYSLSIASASIIAKVVRDRWLGVVDRRYPAYGFARHKGYGTKEHYAALEREGPIEGFHRRTFLKKLMFVEDAFLPLSR